MPKAITYKANSIIYFKGDRSEKVYILNQGKINLNSIDIETGSDTSELIKTGEFFGVKSAMGRYPREETAAVLTDSKVIAFSVSEFEQLVSKNTRIIIKMLKVFSTQLRRIHKQVQNLMYYEEHGSPEQGLYKIGEYYLKKKKYTQAIYAFDRYLVFYPTGKNADNATKNIKTAEKFLQDYGQGGGPSLSLPDMIVENSPRKEATTTKLSVDDSDYYDAMSLMTKDKYDRAAAVFKKIIDRGTSEEFVLKSRFEIGRCLFHMGRFKSSIQVLSALVQKYPKHPDFINILHYIGLSNENIGEREKAVGIYKKILSITNKTDPVYDKAMSALKQLQVRV